MAGPRLVVALSLVCLAGGSVFAATDDDPFAPKPGTDTPPATGTTPTTPTNPTTPVVPATPSTTAPATPAPLPPECEGVNLTDDLCKDSNMGLLAKSAGYALIGVLLFSILRMWWNKRGTSNAGVRFVFPMLLAGAAAGTLAGIDPLRSRILKCCIANQDFVSKVHLQDSEVARAVLLGALPAIGIYVIVAVVEKLVKR